MSVVASGIQLALRVPLLDYIAGLPTPVTFAPEGKRFSPSAGVVWVSDLLNPTTQSLVGHSRIRGRITMDGFYVIQWHGLPNQGLALRDTAADVVALYPPGTSLVTVDGNAVQIGVNPAPTAGAVRPVDGASVVTITVPYQCVTVAPIAA